MLQPNWPNLPQTVSSLKESLQSIVLQLCASNTDLMSKKSRNVLPLTPESGTNSSTAQWASEEAASKKIFWPWFIWLITRHSPKSLITGIKLSLWTNSERKTFSWEFTDSSTKTSRARKFAFLELLLKKIPTIQESHPQLRYVITCFWKAPLCTFMTLKLPSIT